MSEVKDLAGQRFGRLTVTNRAPNRGKRVCWNCICDCGNSTVVSRSNLIGGQTRSCGCLHREAIARMKDLTGQQFGRLRVVRLLSGGCGNKKAIWECRCSCGKLRGVDAGNLTKGYTRSCGCEHKEISSRNIKLLSVLGTKPSAIRSPEDKLCRANTSGVKGVYYSKSNNVWVAQINFQGVRYQKSFSKFEDAVAARKKMRQIHEEFISWWDSLSAEERLAASEGYESSKATQKALIKQRLDDLF